MNTIYIDKQTGRAVVVNTPINFTDGTPHLHTADEVHPNDVYLTNGVIKIKPPRPDFASRFDMASETWVHDPATGSEQVRNQRIDHYPPIGDQLDMLWHAMKAGQIPKAEPFYSKIEAVKARFPKPSN